MTPVITSSAANALQLSKNGSYSNEGNILQHTLYDTEPYDATTARPTTTFFSVPQGQTNKAGNAKSATETNMTDPGKLPNGQTFLMRQIDLASLFAVAGADIDANIVLAAYYNLIQNSIFEIKIAGREFDNQTPGTRFLPATPISGLFSGANGFFPQASQIGTGAVKLAATPIPVGQLVNFSVIQRTGSGTAAVATIVNTASDVLSTQNAQLQIRLGGILTRAI
jgi:hypothetical protein